MFHYSTYEDSLLEIKKHYKSFVTKETVDEHSNNSPRECSATESKAPKQKEADLTEKLID